MKDKDAYYFPHDSNARNDYKLLRLRAKFGWEGYGIYFAIIEVLREQTNYTLGRESSEALATALGKPVEWVKDFVGDLIELKLLSKEDGGGLFSESLINRMQHYTDQKEYYREQGKKGAKARWYNSLSPLKTPNGIKVNKIKVNKIKKSSFLPPALIELQNYIKINNYSVDAEQFINFYSSKGWMVGKNKMKDWQAAVRTWQKRNGEAVKIEVTQSFNKDPLAGLK